MQVKLSISPSHSILTPGQPVPALALPCQASNRVATGVPIFKSPICLDSELSQRKQELNPGSDALKRDALTTRPMGRSDREREKDKVETELKHG